MKLTTCINNALKALAAWFLVVFVPGLAFTLFALLALTASGLYDPATAPDHNTKIVYGFLVLMAVAYAIVYRVIAKKDSGAA